MKRRHKYALHALANVIQGVQLALNDVRWSVSANADDSKMIQGMIDNLDVCLNDIAILTEDADDKVKFDKTAKA